MREYREVRLRVGGDVDAASPYIGFARTLLGQLKNEMGFAGLLQGVRRKSFSNGVLVEASSIFGQDTIRIYVPPPPETPEEEEERTYVVIEELIGAGVAWDSDYGGLAIPLKWTPLGGLERLTVFGGDYPYGQANCIAPITQHIFGYCFADYLTPLNLLYRACYWDADGVHDLGFYGIPVGVSDDGNQILYWTYDTDDITSVATYLYDRVTGRVDEITPPDGWAGMVGTGLSGDGKIAVGDANTSSVPGAPGRSSWRWTLETGAVDIGHAVALDSSGNTQANGISADGTTICAKSQISAGDTYPFVWVDGVITQLPGPAGYVGRTQMVPRALSRHGSVVVGSFYSYDDDDYHAFRYQAGVTHLLPKNEDDENQRIGAWSVTKDGAVTGSSYVQFSGDSYDSPLVYKGNDEAIFVTGDEWYSPEILAINRKRMRVYSDGEVELIEDNEDTALLDTGYEE